METDDPPLQGANMVVRPPLGMIVEGKGEFHTLEDVLRAGIVAPHGRVPIACTRGSGALRKRLEEFLEDLVKTWHPVSVIVTVDVHEVLREGKHADCQAFRAELQDRSDLWLERAMERRWPSPLPEAITVVVQVPGFESWIAADGAGLAKSGLLKRGSVVRSNWNADDQDPAGYLAEVLKAGCNCKHVDDVTRLMTRKHPERMSLESRSFRKFWKEVRRAYETWSTLTGQSIVYRGP